MGQGGRTSVTAQDIQATDSGPAGLGGWRADLPFYAISAVSIFLLTSIDAASVADDLARIGQLGAPWEPYVWEFSSGLVLLLMTPAIVAVTRRAWPRRPPPFGWIAIHLGAALAVSLAHVIAMGVIRWAIYALLSSYYDPLGPLSRWPYELRKDLLVYAGTVTVYVVWRLLRARPVAASASTPASGPEVLEVRDGARRHFVPLSEVVWIEAAGNYVELHRGVGGLLHRASLADMERQLQRAGFVRIHRSRLVRRDAIAGIDSKPTGDFVVRLHDGRELAGSRRYRHPLLAD
jgi:hypothetical protein